MQFHIVPSYVLQVISRSPDALQPVLDAIVETSRDLCNSDAATMFLLRDGKFHFTAIAGLVPKHMEYLKVNPATAADPMFKRLMRLKRTLHFPNVMDDPELSRNERTVLGGPRALLVTPLLRDGEPIGAIALRQSHLRPFTPRQIQAIEVFADQAVIAISNVELFEQVQARTRDVSEALRYQIGSANILKVIASSPTDVGPVLLSDRWKALASFATPTMRSCCSAATVIYTSAHITAPYPSTSTNGQSAVTGHLGAPSWTEQRYMFTTFFRRKPMNSPKPRYCCNDPDRWESAPFLRFPSSSEGESIGAILLRRKQVQPFAEKQVSLLRTFADQAVIAIQNARLFNETGRHWSGRPPPPTSSR